MDFRYISKNLTFLAFETLCNIVIILFFIELFLIVIIPNQFELGRFRIDDIWSGMFAIFNDDIAGKAVDPINAIYDSFFRTLFSILFSALFGIIIGVSLISLGKLGSNITPLMDYIRGIPITFLIPFAYFFKEVSLSWWLPVALTCVPCSLIVSMAIAEQGLRIDPDRRIMAKSLLGRTRQFAYWRHFVFWEVLSGFLIGFRAIVPYATVLVGVLEYAGLGGSRPGFGNIIYMLNGNNSDLTIVIPLISAIIAYGFFSLGFLVVFSSSIRWITNQLGLQRENL